jgi:hypothetical protein
MNIRNTVITLSAALIMLCSSFNVHALGREVSYGELFDSHPGSITRMTTCGSWVSKTKSGEFRIIEAYLYGQSFLYIDRVAVNADQTGMDIVGTISIAEFNNDHAEFDLSKLSCKPLKNSVEIQLIASSAYDDSVKKVKIQIRADDTYRIQGL